MLLVHVVQWFNRHFLFSLCLDSKWLIKWVGTLSMRTYQVLPRISELGKRDHNSQSLSTEVSLVTPQVLFSRTVLFLNIILSNLLCMYNCQVTEPKSAQVTFHTDANWFPNAWFFCQQPEEDQSFLNAHPHYFHCAHHVSSTIYATSTSH